MTGIRFVYCFVSGAPLDGREWTDATFLQPPTKAARLKAARSWWHWRPGWHRAAIRIGTLALVLAIAAGLILDFTATVASLAAVTAAGFGYAAWRIGRGAVRWLRAAKWAWDDSHPWKSAGRALVIPAVHHLHYVRPLKARLTGELGVMPAKVRVPLDRSGAVIGMPIEYTGSDKRAEGVTRAVTTTLALEAPDVAAKLAGRNPRITFTKSDPPPRLVTWEDLAGEIRSAKSHELIAGVGKRATTTRVSLELDSPHFGVISGTGGGKSTLAGFWLLQELMRGSIALILDAKRFSHPWTYKDMDAEYGLLPNVAYCRTISDLHDAMVWLGAELDRRNDVAEVTIDAKGNVRGDVGPRLWVIAEEMNLAKGPLKAHWAAIRGPDDPKRSPAFTGLGAVSYAGRAARMHLVTIGQMLTAEVLGGGDVRENIGVRMMTRYTQNSWKMQAGDIPMPPPPTIPGRWQCLVGSEVREVQVPLLDMAQARELATSGIIGTPRPDMPGRSGAPSVVPAPYSPIDAPDQPFAVGHDDIEVGMTIREAIADGIFGPLSLEAARKRVQRAGIEPLPDRRGDGSYTYDRAALFAAARQQRKELAR